MNKLYYDLLNKAIPLCVVLQCAQSELDMDLVKTILGEYKIHNADITLRYDATSEDLIDVIEGNRIYIPCIYILNKIDQISIEVGFSLVMLDRFVGSYAKFNINLNKNSVLCTSSLQITEKCYE